jgi:UDP-GlcNAc3NAcA epimerase
MSKKIMTVIGARPQFIKAAPLSLAIRECGMQEVIVHTGQHFDASMSDVFFDELGIPEPAYKLEINSLGHGAMTGRMLEALEGVVAKDRPDWMLIYGDTNSTLAGALCASKLGIPVAHVESGLRSYNRAMPEEINRVVADHLSDLLFCPTTSSVSNLRKEGIQDGVHLVGDVMYDATLAATKRAENRSSVLERLSLTPRTYAVATIHRAENTDDLNRFRRIISYLEAAADRHTIVMPVHPRTRKLMERENLRPAGVRLTDPLGYLDMCWLTHNCAEVLTDSGGLQKEAYFHKVPCTTLRDETEWNETIEAGWNRLWTHSDFIGARGDIADYGDGRAAQKISDILLSV